jgi:hypothetical protein
MHALGATPVNAVLNTGGWIHPHNAELRTFSHPGCVGEQSE